MAFRRSGFLLLVSLLLGSAAPLALAMPADPPILSQSPADGASIPAGQTPITVSYTCPGYASDGLGNVGGPSDYDVAFSRGPALDAEGQLADRSRASGPPVVGVDGTCSSELGTAGGSDSPRATGGRVYWQPFRSCSNCGGPSQLYEYGAVRSFTVAVAAVSPTASTATLTAPRLYAGYRQVVTLRTTADFTGQLVQLQRRSGSRWVTLANEPFSKTIEFVALVPAGSQQLRAVALTAADPVTLATRTVTVARTGRRTTSRRDDGRYTQPGSSPTNLLQMRVSANGRTLSAFRATVTTQCPQPNGVSRFQTTPTAVDRVPIAPDGTVVYSVLRPGGAETRLIGRVRQRRFTGTIFADVGACFGTRAINIVRK